jgi:hypothetical protein
VKRWTPALAVSRSRRKIESAIARLREVSIEWSDVDESFVFEAEQLIAELETFADQIRDDVEERLKAGEEIGI